MSWGVDTAGCLYKIHSHFHPYWQNLNLGWVGGQQCDQIKVTFLGMLDHQWWAQETHFWSFLCISRKVLPIIIGTTHPLVPNSFLLPRLQSWWLELQLPSCAWSQWETWKHFPQPALDSLALNKSLSCLTSGYLAYLLHATEPKSSMMQFRMRWVKVEKAKTWGFWAPGLYSNFTSY